MNNRTKLMIGLFLITGILVISYLGVTNMVVGDEPPEQDPHDPGNARGPGVFTSLPPKPIEFVADVDIVLDAIAL